jgi:hypothetical protein
LIPSPYSRTTALNSNGSSSSLKRSFDVSNEGNNSLSHYASQQQQQQQQQHTIPINSHISYNNSSLDHDLYHPTSHNHHHHHHNSAINGVVGDDLVDCHPRMSSNIGHNLNNRNNGQQSHRNPDIMRKPIK